MRRLICRDHEVTGERAASAREICLPAARKANRERSEANDLVNGAKRAAPLHQECTAGLTGAVSIRGRAYRRRLDMRPGLSIGGGRAIGRVAGTGGNRWLPRNAPVGQGRISQRGMGRAVRPRRAGRPGAPTGTSGPPTGARVPERQGPPTGGRPPERQAPASGGRPPGRSGPGDLDVQRGGDLGVQPHRDLVRADGLDRVLDLDPTPVQFGAARGLHRGRDVDWSTPSRTACRRRPRGSAAAPAARPAGSRPPWRRRVPGSPGPTVRA